MLNILLIDDNPTVVQDTLTIYGYDVSTATDGFAGIQILMNTQSQFDLVILDVNMPKMDGWAVLKAIRDGEECPDIPVIMLTSNDNEESLVAGLRRGADEYLTKPITPKRLLAHIEVVSRRIKRESQTSKKHQDGETKTANPSGDLLTQRETEILKYIVQGLSNQQIGETLTISETTVKNHLAHIYKKLNVSNRTQAAFLAQKLKLF